jgi:predicted esterase
VIERSIPAGTHGRFLVEPPAVDGAAPLLVGFHGYGELAEAQLHRLRAIPGAERWRIVAIQGLHRFYQRRTNEVVASWMTRQDRDLAIADNLAYTAAVLDAVAREWPGAPRVVFAGFSQGVAMTFRAAIAAPTPVDGVIAVGGDIPPEIDATALARVRSALVGAGASDEWYTAQKFDSDVRRLTDAGARVEPVRFDGGHEWHADVIGAATRFLLRVAGS